MSESPDPASAAEASDLSLDEIIAELDQPYSGKVPERALRAAQRHAAEITPRLVELLRARIAGARGGRFRDADGHFLAMLLLVEFHAAQARPLLLELCGLSDQQLDKLMGDLFYELLPAMLAGLIDSVDTLDALVSNRDFATHARWEVPEVYLYLVRDGRMTQAEAGEHLRRKLAQAIAEKDTEGATWIANELLDIDPSGARDQIDAAFRDDLIDLELFEPGDVDAAIAHQGTAFQQAIERLRDTGVPDTVELLREWEQEFPDPDESEPAPSSEVARFWEPIPEDVWDPGDDDPFKPSVPLHTAHKKVGRNELCPCGSGKKFKKCCGRH